MLNILSLFDFEYLTYNEQINLIFTSEQYVDNIINNKYIFYILYHFLIKDKYNSFSIIFNRILKIYEKDDIIKLLSSEYEYINCLGISENINFIEKCLDLNRLDFLIIINNNIGFINNFNYYSLVFKNVDRALFNQPQKIKVINYLYNNSYKPNYPILEITDYTAKFLDIWKYSTYDSFLKNNIYHVHPLHLFAQIKNFNKLKNYAYYFINNNIYNINCCDKFNRTPITYAIEFHNIEYAIFLLENNCDIYNIDKFNCNLLHYLCIQDNIYENNLFFSKIWKYLKNKKNINQMIIYKNIKQYTPIEYLLNKGNFFIFKNIYYSNLIKCNTLFIDIVHKGFNTFFKNKQNIKSIEKIFQYNEYLKLTKLLINESMNFHKKDYISKIKNTDNSLWNNTIIENI